MTLEEAKSILKKDRDLCMFNPMTGEQKPMNEDCRQSAEAYDRILTELTSSENDVCSECEFCESYKLWNEIHSSDDEHPKIYHEYTVALVCRSWTKAKGKRRADRTTDYGHKGLGYELNFCPECGKALRRKEDG